MVKTYTKHWKNLKAASANDVVVHCALKAFFAKSTNTTSKENIFRNQISKSFTPITNKIKLANGAKSYEVVDDSLKYLAWVTKPSIFGLNFKNAIEHIFENDENKYNEFCIFLKSLAKAKLSYKRRYYTYIFVDQENVEPIYQSVQASHVAMVIGQKMNSTLPSDKIYFQLCKKPVGVSIDHLGGYLIDAGFDVEKFYEPDVNRTIAIGTHPVPSYKRNKLEKYDLLTF